MKIVVTEPRTSNCAIDAERSSNKAFFENADKPTLHGLSYALRHPDTWPEGFVWDYGECGQCAMGLAHALWEQVPKANKKTGASFMARTFSLPFNTASSIFMGNVGPYRARWIPDAALKTVVSGHLWWRVETTKPNWNAITPEMVADQIDKYLATAE